MLLETDEHRTLNIEHRMFNGTQFIQHSMFDVGCSTFVF